jgi:hypothetical protein
MLIRRRGGVNSGIGVSLGVALAMDAWQEGW